MVSRNRCAESWMRPRSAVSNFKRSLCHYDTGQLSVVGISPDMTHALEALPGQMRTAERLENVPRGTANQLRPRRPFLTSLTPIFLRNAVGNSAPIIAKMMSL